MYPSVTRIKLRLIAGHYGYSLTGDICDRIEETLDAISIFMKRVNVITPEEFSARVVMGRTVIFEGAQGVLLDMDHGFFPHVTRSRTTSHNALRLCERMRIPTNDISITHVTRTYHTRHGNGPFVDGVLDIDDMGTESNHWGRFQGDFRVGPLDMNLLRYAKRCECTISNSIPPERRNLFIACCDTIDPSKELMELSSEYQNTILSYSDDVRENHRILQNSQLLESDLV
jgi:adenylosuccinate synthase